MIASLNRMVLTGITLLACAALPGRAQDNPSTQPSTQPSFRRGGGGPPMSFRNMTPEEQASFREFMKAHMPNLNSLLAEMPRPSPRRRALYSFAIVRMHNLERAQDDSDLADKVARGIEEEDEIFKLAIQLRGAPADQRDTLRTAMHDKMKSLIDGLLDERADRLAKLKAKVDEEQRKLEDDRANRETLVARRLELFLGELDRSMAAPDAPTNETTASTTDTPPPTSANAPAQAK